MSSFTRYQLLGTIVMLGRKADRSRLLFLLCGIVVEADTVEPLGLEEYNNVAGQDTNRREISKLAAGKDFEKNHITHDSAGPWAGGCRRC